jgi:hypothetical protein
MSAQLRSVVMHRRRSATISSPRHAAAQAVQALGAVETGVDAGDEPSGSKPICDEAPIMRAADDVVRKYQAARRRLTLR